LAQTRGGPRASVGARSFTRNLHRPIYHLHKRFGEIGVRLAAATKVACLAEGAAAIRFAVGRNIRARSMDDSGPQLGTAIDRSAGPFRERRADETRGSDLLQRQVEMRPPPAETRPIVVPPSPLSFRNVRMMHLLERIATRFNEAKVPLMALKGAALNLTLYEQPDQRPMGDLDLMVRHEDIESACALLEAMGGLRGEPLVRDDFFPRFHYELEYTLGDIYPVKIDLHVRPFRPLRYARTVPDHALWQGAESVSVGKATVLIPSTEDMLIHLCVHAAVHGCSQRKWISEIGQWVHRQRTRSMGIGAARPQCLRRRRASIWDGST